MITNLKTNTCDSLTKIDMFVYSSKDKSGMVYVVFSQKIKFLSLSPTSQEILDVISVTLEGGQNAIVEVKIIDLDKLEFKIKKNNPYTQSSLKVQVLNSKMI